MSGVCGNWIREQLHDQGKQPGYAGGYRQLPHCLLTFTFQIYFKGKIYQGNAKTVCVPGLNCYSCPAATGACPIGAFQAVIGSSRFKFSYYVTGFFILLGVTLGRFICGFLCPFGWFQDLLHKIPGKKIFHSRTETAKISEIYNSYRFRYPSAAARNELYRNGRPLLL